MLNTSRKFFVVQASSTTPETQTPHTTPPKWHLHAGRSRRLSQKLLFGD